MARPGVGHGQTGPALARPGLLKPTLPSHDQAMESVMDGQDSPWPLKACPRPTKSSHGQAMAGRGPWPDMASHCRPLLAKAGQWVARLAETALVQNGMVAQFLFLCMVS